ncbi:DNA recombination protein RmuC [Methylococcus sp. EFPC2]|uniref:DNA recombination protein RmuC n=1 Tax=Methylococcus sp. EFPC2 TaxID=2812648 RepID=UPI00196781D8|nr:DNA recombination protein RmuC [Methylococcus sp. EFPC2]QSA95466.1 DNA recombination protein RmuC [Methylococcus sp. EFPC2]
MSDLLIYLLLGVPAGGFLISFGLLFWLAARNAALLARLDAARDQIERLERGLREEIVGNRQELNQTLALNREELAAGLHRLGEQLGQQLSSHSQRNAESIETLRLSVEQRLTAIQVDNNQKLEQMRQTVDEKLHNTLEQRLGESFKLVSERLEQVHKGLGEMQSLASGVGDLKKVLTNVKVRGTWGEVQLENLLEQMLTVDQYARNVATRPGSNERVEFAIRLPGRDEQGSTVWLPIDAKFPLEDYQKLVDAREVGEVQAMEELGKALETRIRNEAKSIRDKYLEPPHTTDFGLLFLPVEGLYAEVIRRPGLFDQLQRDFRVTVTGPTTLSAILNSLQMGFRTLAIEKRSSEVWKVLGAVKTEFGKFGDVLAKTRKKLDEARNTIDQAEVRTRQIGRQLVKVESLPVDDARQVWPEDLALPELEDDEA